MKKFYVAVLFSMFLMWGISSQHLMAQAPTIEIGDGTEDQGLPIHPYISYSYSQTIFLQEELDVEGQRIHKIAFYYEGGRLVDDPVRILMAHTSQETLTDFVTDGLTLVYEGAYPVMNQEGWYEISLTTPFEYNNEDNLLIAMTEDQPGFRLNTKFYSTAVDDNKSILATKDISPAFDPFNPPSSYQLKNYRPNLRLWFEDIPAGPAMSIQPAQLYYLYIKENEEKSLNVNVYNTGTEDLVITGLDNNNLPFATDYTGTIAPGESDLVDIRFVPQQPGAYNGFVMLESNTSVDPVHIYVEAFAVNEMAIVETFQETTFPPEQWSVDPNTWTRRGFGGFEGGGNAYLNTGTEEGYLKTPKLNIQQGDELIFYAAQQLDGELTVSHSYDMETWTELETIVLPRSFVRYIIDLDDYQGQGYIGFSGVPRIYLDYIVAPAIYIETPPNPSTNPLPADGFQNAFVTQQLKWNASALAEGYKVYLGTDNPPTNIIDGEDLGSLRTFKTPVLDYDTEYFWQIVPYNQEGDAVDCPVWSFTTAEYLPVSDFPFEERFEENEGLVPPAGWINQDAFWVNTTNAHSGEFAARASFNHPEDAILISPPLQLPDAAEMELTFYWKNGNVYGKNAADDKIINHDTLYVEVTADFGQTWEVKNILSAPASMPNYLPANADLSEFAGEEIYIRFRHSTNSNANNAKPVGIDDIMIQGSATEPIIWLNEDNWVAGTIANHTWVTSSEFRLQNLGADVLTVSEATFDGDGFTTTFDQEEVSLGFGEEYTFTFAFEPTEADNFLRTFTIETNGGTAEIELFGTSEPVEPFAFESFEDGLVPPHGWMTHDMNGDELAWMRAWNHAIPAHTGTFSAISFSFDPYVGDLNPDNWLVTSSISVEENQEFAFWVAAGDLTYHADHISVLLSNTTNRLEEFKETLWEETLPADTTFFEVVVDMTPYAGQDVYIAFRHHNTPEAQYIVRLDDIEIRDIVEEVDAPYADPAPGIVEAGTEVTLMTDTEEADIFYTLDGTDPDTGSTLFESPVIITEDVVIKAVTWKNDVYSEIVEFEYIIDDTSVDFISEYGVKVYPNPASGKLWIDKMEGVSMEASLVNMYGAEVKFILLDGQTTTVDLDGITPGVYFLRLHDGNTNFQTRIVIQ